MSVRSGDAPLDRTAEPAPPEGTVRSHERPRAVLDDLTELVVRVRPDGAVTFANEAYCRFFGTTREALVGAPAWVGAPEAGERWASRTVTSLTPAHPAETVEQRTTRPEGAPRWVQWADRGIFDETGALLELQSVGRDVTERREFEDRLLEAQKMEAVGQLAAGLAHDFNNLLAIVMGRSHLLLSSLDATEPIRRHAEEIARAADQFASLTRQLLAFGRRQVLRPKPLALDTVLESIEPMLRRVIPEDVALIVRRGMPPGWVEADPHQLEQVVLSLALNARDAMPRGGRLVIESSAIRLDPVRARQLGLAARTYAVLAVRDSGHGMDAETRARLFEPFFTTKSRGAEKGTGLGLAVVYGIVKQSGGHVSVDSEPGHGTSLTVYLPLRETGQEP